MMPAILGMDGRMRGLRMSGRAWHIALATLVLLALLVVGYEARHGVPRAWGETVGRLGVDRIMLGPGRMRVTGLESWSPLRAAGVSAGDVVVAERWYDLERGLQPGEALRLGVERGGGMLPITVQAVAGPHASLAFRLFTPVQAVTCLAGIVFGALIGWRRSRSAGGRALALAFIVSSINLYPASSPPGWPQQVEQLAFSLALAPGWFAMTCFAVLHPDDAPTGLRARLARGLPALAVAGLVVLGVTALRGLGLSARLHVPAVTAYAFVTGLVVIACLLSGWRHSVGSQRMRYAWLLATFALFVVPSWFPGPLEYLGWAHAGWFFLAMSLCSLLAYAGLAYAVLRHRVIDLGVALGRSLVLAAVGLVVLGGIKLLELTLVQAARPGDPVLAALVGAGLAVTGFVAYRHLRPRVDSLMEHLLFPRWSARVRALRRMVAEAGDAPDAQALAGSFVRAVEAFTLGGGAAVYVQEPGWYRLLASSFDGARGVLAPDDAVLAAMRARDLRPSEAGAAVEADEVAVPMTHRPGIGLVLLVTRRVGASAWHDDDLCVLEEVAVTVGTDLLWLGLKAVRGGPFPPRRD